MSEGNTEMLPVDSVFHPLAMATHVLDSQSPDFAVIQLPPAILHSLTVLRLCEGIVHFLANHNAVRIDVSFVRKCGVPQSRRLLTMIVSPYHGIANVPMTQANNQRSLAGQEEGQPITQSIADLSFRNYRSSGTGYVCSLPSGDSHCRNPPSILCYNHYTGCEVPEDRAQVANLELHDIDFLTYSTHSLVHPGK